MFVILVFEVQAPKLSTAELSSLCTIWLILYIIPGPDLHGAQGGMPTRFGP